MLIRKGAIIQECYGVRFWDIGEAAPPAIHGPHRRQEARSGDLTLTQ